MDWRGHQLHHPEGAICDTVTAANAGVAVDADITVWLPADGIWRAVFHAARVITMATGHRHMNGRKGIAGFTLQSRDAAMCLGTGLLTVVATNTE